MAETQSVCMNLESDIVKALKYEGCKYWKKSINEKERKNESKRHHDTNMF